MNNFIPPMDPLCQKRTVKQSRWVFFLGNLASHTYSKGRAVGKHWRGKKKYEKKYKATVRTVYEETLERWLLDHSKARGIYQRSQLFLNRFYEMPWFQIGHKTMNLPRGWYNNCQIRYDLTHATCRPPSVSPIGRFEHCFFHCFYTASIGP